MNEELSRRIVGNLARARKITTQITSLDEMAAASDARARSLLETGDLSDERVVAEIAAERIRSEPSALDPRRRQLRAELNIALQELASDSGAIEKELGAEASKAVEEGNAQFREVISSGIQPGQMARARHFVEELVSMGRSNSLASWLGHELNSRVRYYSATADGKKDPLHTAEELLDIARELKSRMSSEEASLPSSPKQVRPKSTQSPQQSA